MISKHCTTFQTIKMPIRTSLGQFTSILKRRLCVPACFPTHLNGFSPSGFQIHGVRQCKLSLLPADTLDEHSTQDTSACENYVRVTQWYHHREQRHIFKVVTHRHEPLKTLGNVLINRVLINNRECFVIIMANWMPPPKCFHIPVY